MNRGLTKPISSLTQIVLEASVPIVCSKMNYCSLLVEAGVSTTTDITSGSISSVVVAIIVSVAVLVLTVCSSSVRGSVDVASVLVAAS